MSPVIPGESINEINIAENQPEYQTLPVIPLSNGCILSRWEMDEAERKIVSVTGELFINFLTFGQPPPDCLFQVDNPIASDSPEAFLEQKTAYQSGGLPVLAKNENEIWLLLKLTDLDRKTVAKEGNVYFFMETGGKPITPSLIQVEKPDVESIEVEFIVGIRADEKGEQLAKQYNIETFKSDCAICAHDCLVSSETVETINQRNLKIICSVCSADGNPQYCFFPETVKELKRIIEDGKTGGQLNL